MEVGRGQARRRVVRSRPVSGGCAPRRPSRPARSRPRSSGCTPDRASSPSWTTTSETEALAEEAEGIDTRLAEIDEAVKARAVYKPEDIAIAGCIVTVGNDGTLQVVQGLVKPEDMPADTDAATSAAASHDGGGQGDGQQTASGIQSPAISGPAMPPARPDPEAEARKEAGVGIGLAEDLRAIRSGAGQGRISPTTSGPPSTSCYSRWGAQCSPRAITTMRSTSPCARPRTGRRSAANDDTFHESSPGEAMLADRSSLPFDWLEIEDGAESFAALRALAP